MIMMIITFAEQEVTSSSSFKLSNWHGDKIIQRVNAAWANRWGTGRLRTVNATLFKSLWMHIAYGSPVWTSSRRSPEAATKLAGAQKYLECFAVWNLSNTSDAGNIMHFNYSIITHKSESTHDVWSHLIFIYCRQWMTSRCSQTVMCTAKVVICRKRC